MVKVMYRPSEKVVTPHGVFNIIKHDPQKNDLRPTCYNCFYKTRKVAGAPCVEGKWCGDLYCSLEPSTLTEKGKQLRDSEVIRTTTKIAAR